MPDRNPTVSDLKDFNKNIFFSSFFFAYSVLFEGTWNHSSKIKS
jgi:hypothetical protein